MQSQTVVRLYNLLGLILVFWGVVFSIWGFGIFVDWGILPANSLVPWESGIYGAMMIGLAVILFGVGRIAIQKKDAGLLNALLMGLAVWLVLEAIVSALLGVWFNVGVDVAVLALFGFVVTKAKEAIK